MIHRKVLVALLIGVAAALVVTYAVASPADAGSSQPNVTHRNGAGMSQREMVRRRFVQEARRRFGAERMKLMGSYIGLIGQMKRVAFDPNVAGLLAVGGLKDDVKRKRQDVIKDLESQLQKTRSLGLRNSIRLALKDLYKAEGQSEKVLENYRAMLAENDAAIGAATAERGK